MIAVWFSCGAASAVAIEETLRRYPQEEVRVINNPIKEEDEDNSRFLRDVSEYLNVPIELAVNSKYPNGSCWEVWEDRKFMSGPLGAPCTIELKKRARQEWELKEEPEEHVLGFTVEEKNRYDRFILTERPNVLPVLIDAGLTKQDCVDRVQSEWGLTLPKIYSLGYPNANCVGCVKATSPTYWNKVRETHPDVFNDRAQQSRRFGSKLVRVKGERIFLDELDPAARGHPLRSLSIECGIFCEETE